MADEAPATGIVFAQPGDPNTSLTIAYVPREMRVHQITEDELRMLRTGANSPSLALLGIALGLVATSVTTLATVDLPNRTFAVFVAVLLASTLLTLFFGFHASRDFLAVRALIDRIERKGRR